MAAESPPTMVSRLSEPEHHGEACLSRTAAVSASLPQGDRREGALDGFDRLLVTPALGGGVVDGEEEVPVP